MPGCAAVGCTNSNKKRFLMKHFPIDAARRKMWLEKMKRDNWVPTNYSCLCEVHFEDQMWEKTREGGSKRLKCDAVPTQFFLPYLVLMLGGISTRWKKTVAYFFTGKSVNGNVYHDIVVDIISKTESIGLNVVALISDMGPSNQSLWRKWNITAGRHCKLSNFLPLPLDDNRKLFVIPDVPHLFKNIKNMLVRNIY
ncbi:unnamed protein product [Macrosiphum euphorbiae]|uniref:THAP-type domain-containing protein n=1 Tax=Macrosiphum euphorbiae TaxID=13131 RepID=A0AAV0WCU2_9HEMI|nr:unnamed protein product [Macrosiphum euphorbiae]